MADDLHTTLATYAAAWCEADPARRDALLETCWAADGVYRDPTGEAAGRAALSGRIGGMLVQMPGARIELTSSASVHHGHIHFTWRLVNGAGETVTDGVDFGTLDEEGRIQQMVGFFGPPPALGATDAA